MQAVLKTDMPNFRLLNLVQSATHGLVLFCPIDNGRTRIGSTLPYRTRHPPPSNLALLTLSLNVLEGYVFNEDLQKKYGGAPITQEVAMQVRPAGCAHCFGSCLLADTLSAFGLRRRRRRPSRPSH